METLQRCAAAHICVFNGGLHYENASAFRDAFLERALSLISSRRNSTSFIWSETTPQHFASPDGAFAGHGDNDCSPRKAVSSHFSNAIANPLLKQAGVPILYIEQMTMSQWDAHVVRTFRTDFTVGGAERIDCTHFCLPGIPLSWANLLYNMLMHRSAFFHRATSAACASAGGPRGDCSFG